MQSRTFGKAILVALACLILFPLAAAAQSSIAGLVRDESGGVLPGVTVEASSPVLIEKVRTGVTDDTGRYRITDLRPGTYRVTFGLTGFATVERAGVELPANFTATLNADLKVGSLQETVTVSGETPLVDVQQASRTQVITRDFENALPTTRNIWSIGMLVPGIRMGTPDVGGSHLEQTAPRSHGMGRGAAVQLTDGMLVNSQENGNCCQAYQDDALQAETSIITSAIPADTNWGGIRINVIPKDGGNVFSGAVFLGGTNGRWMSKNIDANLRSRGLTVANAISHIQNFNGSIGGPIMRDKLWFFASARHIATDETRANTPSSVTLPDGTIIRTVADQFVRDSLARLTWQMTSKHKFAAWYERQYKWKGKAFNAGQDPRSADQWDTSPVHGGGQAKLTSTLSSKLLLEAGYSVRTVRYTSYNQKGFWQKGTPLEYAYSRATDTAYNTNFYTPTYFQPGCAYTFGCTVWGSTNQRRMETNGQREQVSLSYVTGTHNLKVGVFNNRGPAGTMSNYNGDLIANYVNMVPQTVTVYNTPNYSKPKVDYDFAVFVQDSWVIKRLTLNPGVRLHWFESEMEAVTMAAGRFAPVRYFAAQKELPKWGPYWDPRLSAAYDLFGDGRTALKASYSKYYMPVTGDFAAKYANAANFTENRNWFDTDLIPGTSTPSGVALATNGDRIVQDNEIGPSPTTNFGTRSDRNPAPGIENVYNWETTATVQHQVGAGLSLSAGYYHRSYRNINITDRQQISNADFTSFTAPMPSFANDPTLNGVLDPNEVLTVYNLNPAKTSVYDASQIDFNSTGQFGPKESMVYNGFDVSFSARLPRTTLTGGWTIERFVTQYCDFNDDPNGVPTTDLYQGWTVSTGGRFCDQSAYSIPYLSEVKFSGGYEMPLGVAFGAVLQSYPGAERTITWSPAASLFPGGRTRPVSIMLTKPGQLHYPRFSQLDINFKKNWRAGHKQYSLQLDFFNVLNANPVFAANNTIGGSLGTVTTILVGRLPRIAFQFLW